MSERTRIRPIEAADDPAIARIIRTVMTEYGAVGEGYSIMDAEVDAMTEAYAGADAAYLVAELDDTIVGGAGIGPLVGGPPDVCELKKMYLLPGARGHGIGRRLMKLCLGAAREAGYARCYLETLGQMIEARALYERNGFAEIDGPMGATGHTGCDGWYLRNL
jgi:putative acetyltransferase